MCQLAEAFRIDASIDRLGRSARSSLRIYLTGGATAVLHGWRTTTIDVDLKRGHGLDLEDASRIVREGLVEKDRLFQLFAAVEPQLFRYPAIDPPSFRRAVERFAD